MRTTLAQAGAVREVIQRGAREGRARLDEARSSRRRVEALADLGEVVLDLLDRGEAPELEDHPDVQAALEAIVELDAGAAPADAASERRRPVAGRDYVTPPRRASFDRGRAPARDDDDGGAVSSRSWRPPHGSPGGGAATRDVGPGGAGQDARVWRPPRDRDPATEPGAAMQVPAKRGTPRGGIAFDDDDDLEGYMHPDDVPAPEPKGKDKK